MTVLTRSRALLLGLLCPLLIPLLPTAGAQEAALTAFTGGRVYDGSGGPPVDDAVLLVRDGRVMALGAAGEVEIPPDSRRVDLAGRFVIPGLINSHGHAGDDTQAKLATWARYGVTTVLSLGGEDAAELALREAQDQPGLDRARLYLAGPILAPADEAQAREELAALAEMGVDWVKIRVDTRRPGGIDAALYRFIIEEAARHGLPVAAHMVSRDDALGLVEAGVGLLAHSVRDREVDETLIAAMREQQVCLSPTLTRDLATFVYADEPEFFSDPFFRREVSEDRMASVLASSAPRSEAQARQGREEYEMALRNLALLAEGGAGIAMGTDSGAFPGRFPGYFEHLEMALMQQAGMSAPAVLKAATGQAAACVGLEEVGTLAPGKWADFVVLEADPGEDIRNARRIAEVWLGGRLLSGSDGADRR